MREPLYILGYIRRFCEDGKNFSQWQQPGCSHSQGIPTRRQRSRDRKKWFVVGASPVQKIVGTAIRKPEEVHRWLHEGWQTTATHTDTTEGFLMKVMLDSNICIYIIKQQPRSVLQRFHAFQVGDIGISAITLAELQYGAMKSDRPRQNRESLKEFVSPLDVAPFDAAAGEAYGEIRAALEKAGRPIGAMDLLIAAHALSLGTRLATNNEREFKRVRGLHIENWI